MAIATNYQCPACGGPLHFVGASNKLECDYCGSSYEVEQIDKQYAQKNEKAVEKDEAKTSDPTQQEFQDPNLREYNCPSCGARLVCDETTAATSCPYCGNNQVIASGFKGAKMPDKIIPFKLEKQAAINALKEHYKGKKLLPSVFSAQNHIEEIKGVYVPFWLFDGHVDADITFEGTKQRIETTSTERIITTSYYDIKRNGTVKFEKISVDASQKMDDALMDSVEPFDYADLRDFTPSYLPGFFAEFYDVSTEECLKRAKNRAENTAVSQIESSIGGYHSLTATKKDVKFVQEKVTHAFLPVWVLSTKWNGKNYLFAMNGQTGKMVGDLPLDKGKFWKHFALITACVAAVVTSILYFIF